MQPCGILIAGGGPVSMALAHALSALGRGGNLRIAQVGDMPPPDERPIALSWGSRLLLERMGCWSAIPVTPITRIHVSQQGGFGRTLISAEDHAIEALGYVVSYRDLVQALSRPVEGIAFEHGRVDQWTVDGQGVHIGQPGGTLDCQLLVLADGNARKNDSGRHLGTETVKAYGQCAICCEVETEKPHGNLAWERFTGDGPLAMLPYRDRYAMVWSSNATDAERMMGLEDDAFLQAAQHCFGQRLGEFRSVGPRAMFPLSLKHRPQAAEPRIIAVGNAAQTLHPVAGQGLNLGLRDAWELAQLIADADRPGMPESAAPGSPAFAQRYAHQRQPDRQALIRLTDGMISAFGIGWPMASAVRGAALAFLDAVPPARRFLSRRMMFGARALP